MEAPLFCLMVSLAGGWVLKVSVNPVQVARISRRAAASAAPVARCAGRKDGAGHGLVECPRETVQGSVPGRAGRPRDGPSPVPAWPAAA